MMIGIVKNRGSSLLVLLALSLSNYSLASNQSKWEIGVDGKVTKNGVALGGALVSLKINSKEEAKIKTTGNGKFIFLLQPDNTYIIEISKPGLVSKSIEFSTKNVPDDKVGKGFPPFPILIELFEEIEGLDIAFLEEPIGKIRYYDKADNFDYDESYTKPIQARLKRLMKNYALKMKELQVRYNEIIVRADASFDMGTYSTAISAYKSALSIKRNDKYAGERINEIQHILEEKKQKKLDARTRVHETKKKALLDKYNRFIDRADNEFNGEDYSRARLSYMEAAKVKADDEYAIGRIEEINNILSAPKETSSSYSGQTEYIKEKPSPKPKKPRSKKKPVRKAIIPAVKDLISKEEQLKSHLQQLALEYGEGVTEIIKVEGNKKTITRIVVRSGMATKYKKIMYGFGTYYKKNGVDITKTIFDIETK
ncbi:MAG TPA: carboxypeptidase regulatory-like domain-containing protein [Flavobacteriales bacterium]|nr:carboxypeptidase regulatory-like domain-containing protein [Flavobacteriales bacterium]